MEEAEKNLSLALAQLDRCRILKEKGASVALADGAVLMANAHLNLAVVQYLKIIAEAVSKYTS